MIPRTPEGHLLSSFSLDQRHTVNFAPSIEARYPHLQSINPVKMKLTAVLFFALASLASVYAQEDPGPSPTESVGCEPHGDHWFVP